MRLLAWNVAGALKRKEATVAALVPDVAVLSEVSRSDVFALWGDRACFLGGPSLSGLTVAGFNGWTVAAVDEGCPERLFGLYEARREGRSVLILAVCVKQAPGGYAAAMRRALDRFEPVLRRTDLILCGDFNQSVALDRRRGVRTGFQPTVDRLREAGQVSAWHQANGEEHGLESRATYYHRRAEAAPFHLDYVFSHRTNPPVALELGGYDAFVRTGLSDHVPLLCTFR